MTLARRRSLGWSFMFFGAGIALQAAVRLLLGGDGLTALVVGGVGLVIIGAAATARYL